MKTLIARLGMAALLGFPLVCAAESFIQAATIVKISLSKSGAAPSAVVQVMQQNGQPLQDCAYNLMRLTNMNEEFEKQMYATLLTAKINGLQIPSIGYEPANYVCELTSVQL